MKNKKGLIEKSKAIIAFSQISILFIQIFAFCFIFSLSIENTNAAENLVQIKKPITVYTDEGKTINYPAGTTFHLSSAAESYYGASNIYEGPDGNFINFNTLDSAIKKADDVAVSGSSTSPVGVDSGKANVANAAENSAKLITINENTNALELARSRGLSSVDALKQANPEIFDEAGNLIPGKTLTVAEDASYNIPFAKQPWQPHNAIGQFAGHALEGLSWATTVLTFTQLIGAFIPGEKGEMVKQAGLAIAAGIMAGKMSMGAAAGFNKWKYGGTGQVGGWGTGISIGIGLLVTYYLLAKIKQTETKESTIEFKCMTWQAPRGGDDCAKCNEDPLMPCSEYRCKSLGQTCSLVNKGTGSDRCIDSAPDDTTSPGIKPWQEILTSEYEYSEVKPRPAGGSSGVSGMKITNPASEDGCLAAFTPFVFGIETTEKDGSLQPSQCKIDFNHTKNFDEMDYYLGENNMYNEQHEQSMALPGTDALNTFLEDYNGTLDIKNDGEYSMYIRCKDGNGNENEDEFVVRFCIDKSQDLTAPVIKSTNPISGSPVLYKVDNTTIQVYTNEPSECRWSRKEASYINMENQMSCTNNLWEMNAEFLYTCTTTLTAIEDNKENNFYFRCKDLQGNEMQDTYKYTLFGTKPLTILKFGPNGTVTGNTNTVVTTLNVVTDNGFKNGESTCYYSQTSDESGYIEMAETGTNIHKQQLDLTSGYYEFYYKCVDLGGNAAYNKTNFTVYVDKDTPLVLRAYDFDNKLYILTDESSSCSYSTSSCNFDLSKNEGISMPYDLTKAHYSEWKTNQNYYIKCKDSYNNQPNPSECSIIVRPYEIIEE